LQVLKVFNRTFGNLSKAAFVGETVNGPPDKVSTKPPAFSGYRVCGSAEPTTPQLFCAKELIPVNKALLNC
jgi:hypothetical protein